eukprot:gene7248-1365_t
MFVFDDDGATHHPHRHRQVTVLRGWRAIVLPNGHIASPAGSLDDRLNHFLHLAVLLVPWRDPKDLLHYKRVLDDCVRACMGGDAATPDEGWARVLRLRVLELEDVARGCYRADDVALCPGAAPLRVPWASLWPELCDLPALTALEEANEAARIAAASEGGGAARSRMHDPARCRANREALPLDRARAQYLVDWHATVRDLTSVFHRTQRETDAAEQYPTEEAAESPVLYTDGAGDDVPLRSSMPGLRAEPLTATDLDVIFQFDSTISGATPDYAARQRASARDLVKNRWRTVLGDDLTDGDLRTVFTGAALVHEEDLDINEALPVGPAVAVVDPEASWVDAAKAVACGPPALDAKQWGGLHAVCKGMDDYAGCPSPDAFRALFTGAAGAGKSEVLDRFLEVGATLGLRHRILVVSPTNAAASARGGISMHSAGLLGYRGSPPQPAQLRKHFNESEESRVWCLVIEEAGMLSTWDWTRVHERLLIAFPEAAELDLPFGGICVLAFGDWVQCPCLEGNGWPSPIARWSPDSVSGWDLAEMQGFQRWWSLAAHVFVFEKKYRTKDPRLQALFDAMRAGDRAGVEVGHQYVCGQCLTANAPPPDDVDAWLDAPTVTSFNAQRALINAVGGVLREKRRGRRPVYVQAHDSYDAKRPVTGALAKELLRMPESPDVRPGLLLLPVGEVLICTTNSWHGARHVSKRLCNGMPWRLVSYVPSTFEPEPEGGWSDPSLPPVVLRFPVDGIVVELPESERRGVAQWELVPGLAPWQLAIPWPATMADAQRITVKPHVLRASRFAVDRPEYSELVVVRWQLPFVLGLAFTVYTAQGRGFPRLYLDLHALVAEVRAALRRYDAEVKRFVSQVRAERRRLGDRRRQLATIQLPQFFPEWQTVCKAYTMLTRAHSGAGLRILGSRDEFPVELLLFDPDGPVLQAQRA